MGDKIDISEVWGMIRMMGGIQRCNSITGSVNEGTFFITDCEKAEVQSESYFKVHL